MVRGRLPGLGDELVRAVKAVVARASREPEFYPVVHRDIRRGPVRRFPYGVLYGIRDDCLVVFAVYHSSRDPLGWHDRLERDAYTNRPRKPRASGALSTLAH